MKGIETITQLNNPFQNPCPKGLSRLKGIETPFPFFPALRVWIFNEVWRVLSERTFPLEGNGNSNLSTRSLVSNTSVRKDFPVGREWKRLKAWRFGCGFFGRVRKDFPVGREWKLTRLSSVVSSLMRSERTFPLEGNGNFK